MKSTIVAASITLMAAYAGVAMAQGRHDEKPHGPPAQQMEERVIVEPKVHPGGRHDVQSHKMAIAAHKRVGEKKKAAEKPKTDTAGTAPTNGAQK